MRTSFAPGRPQVAWRDGYRVIRKAGRYMVFPRASFSEMMGWHGARDGLVEIWNGMPFFSPVWARGPRVVWLHHVHGSMWQMTLPPRLAAMGSAIESRVAPPLYRGTPVITLSESSKRELVDKLHFKPNRVTVVSPGIDPRYTPSGPKSPHPLVLAVGRLVPVKRFHLFIDACADLKARHPDLEAVIVGEGYQRDELAAQIREAGAEQWITLAGRVDDDELLALYRRAWVLCSTSAHEGWGMTITEAAACGTPAVATRIAGHADAIAEGTSGLLVDDVREFAPVVGRVLADEPLRRRLTQGALEHAAQYTWGATAYGTLEVLAEEAVRRRSGT
jgi:glycosyltransferase involved in cell wall biosynthesis